MPTDAQNEQRVLAERRSVSYPSKESTNSFLSTLAHFAVIFAVPKSPWACACC